MFRSGASASFLKAQAESKCPLKLPIEIGPRWTAAYGGGELDKEVRSKLLLSYHKDRKNQCYGFVSNDQMAADRRAGPRPPRRSAAITAESSSTTGSNQQSDICGAPSSCAVAAALMYVLPSSPAPPMHTESSCAAAEQETDVQYVWVYETNQQCMPWPTEEESQQEKLCGAMPAALNASSSWETPLVFYEAEEMYPAV